MGNMGNNNNHNHQRVLSPGTKKIGKHVVPSEAVAVIEFVGGFIPVVPRNRKSGKEQAGEALQRVENKLKARGETGIRVVR